VEWTSIAAQFASLGVGGAIALVVMYWKRQDDHRYASTLRELTLKSNDLACKVTEALIENRAEMVKHNSCIEANTKAMDRLSSVIESVLRERSA